MAFFNEVYIKSKFLGWKLHRKVVVHRILFDFWLGISFNSHPGVNPHSKTETKWETLSWDLSLRLLQFAIIQYQLRRKSPLLLFVTILCFCKLTSINHVHLNVLEDGSSALAGCKLLTNFKRRYRLPNRSKIKTTSEHQWNFCKTCLSISKEINWPNWDVTYISKQPRIGNSSLRNSLHRLFSFSQLAGKSKKGF